ncbi:hypothetical protein KC19_11G151000 [Ceratodon purpureus]|uniref:Phosphotyrosine protein phosphatase I domain-containing protein n=1 Tax=Ceratodon purpureus TaxID=3225 RepID=A0A8T0GE71_CERPU|nr:hypothetical protein KC19_11G151000 [Ceratodon purpureus]
MSFGLPSRILVSYVSNRSAVEFGVSTPGNGSCNWCKCTREGALAMRWRRRDVAFQLDARRTITQSKGNFVYGTGLIGFSSRARGSRLCEFMSSAFDGDMRSISECEDLLEETVDFLDTRCSSSPAISEWRNAADCRLSQAGSPFLAVRCNADSSDKGKEEISWTNESVTTATSALAEWRSARTRSGQDLVDWGRYHLQVMFVDRSHRARSRLAEGIFERIAAWNGFGLILYGHSCGISVKEGELPSMSYKGEAQRLGVARHVFQAPATTLDRSDLDSYDLIVAMDIEVRDEALRMASSQPSNGNDYANKVRLISEFVSYGTTSLLEDTLLEIIQPDLPQALTALEVQATYMSQYSKWRMMVATITMCCAGLIQFLMDAYPDDLPDYDPVD